MLSTQIKPKNTIIATQIKRDYNMTVTINKDMNLQSTKVIT